MHKKVVLGTALIFTVLVALIIYSQLGGLDEVVFETIDEAEYVLYGQSFEGWYSDPNLEKIFFETREVLDKAFPQGSLVVVNYAHEDARDGKVRQFIGILTDSEIARIPLAWEKKDISFNKGIRATITAHNLTMPKPQKVRIAAEEKAAVQGWRLADYSLEIYRSERKMVVEFPERNTAIPRAIDPGKTK